MSRRVSPCLAARVAVCASPPSRGSVCVRPSVVCITRRDASVCAVGDRRPCRDWPPHREARLACDGTGHGMAGAGAAGAGAAARARHGGCPAAGPASVVRHGRPYQTPRAAIGQAVSETWARAGGPRGERPSIPRTSERGYAARCGRGPSRAGPSRGLGYADASSCTRRRPGTASHACARRRPGRRLGAA